MHDLAEDKVRTEKDTEKHWINRRLIVGGSSDRKDGAFWRREPGLIEMHQRNFAKIRPHFCK
jgi:hypothetical protein